MQNQCKHNSRDRTRRSRLLWYCRYLSSIVMTNPCGLPPRVSFLMKLLEKMLPEHPRVKPLAHYVPATKMEHPHDFNPKGWWTFQLVNAGDDDSKITNLAVNPQIRVTGFCVDPTRALGIVEIIGEVLLSTNWNNQECDQDHYITSCWRSAVTLPVVYRPKVNQNSAVGLFEFALKRRE